MEMRIITPHSGRLFLSIPMSLILQRKDFLSSLYTPKKIQNITGLEFFWDTVIPEMGCLSDTTTILSGIGSNTRMAAEHILPSAERITRKKIPLYM